MHVLQKNKMPLNKVAIDVFLIESVEFCLEYLFSFPVEPISTRLLFGIKVNKCEKYSR